MPTLPRRARYYKHHVDETYFDHIDTEPKAYWLGFLYADGCVNVKTGQLVLVLAEKDREQVERFAADMAFTGPVYTKEPKRSVIGDKVVNASRQWGVSICRDSICEQMIRLGCTPRKSLTLTWPTEEQVPTHLLRHFIRGYFDGDGSISRSTEGSRNRYKVSVLGTYHFLSGLRNHLASHGIRSTKIRQDRSSHVLTYGGNNVVKAVYRVLYDGATRSLERKRSLFEACDQQGPGLPHFAHTYLFRRATGEEVIIHNLAAYCREHDLKIHRFHYRLLYGGTYAGLTFVSRTNDSHEKASDDK